MNHERHLCHMFHLLLQLRFWLQKIKFSMNREFRWISWLEMRMQKHLVLKIYAELDEHSKHSVIRLSYTLVWRSQDFKMTFSIFLSLIFAVQGGLSNNLFSCNEYKITFLFTSFSCHCFKFDPEQWNWVEMLWAGWSKGEDRRVLHWWILLW